MIHIDVCVSFCDFLPATSICSPTPRAKGDGRDHASSVGMFVHTFWWLVWGGRYDAAVTLQPHAFLSEGDWGTITACLKEANLPETLEGAREFLKTWAKRIEAIYLMASTPADFQYGPHDCPRSILTLIFVSVALLHAKWHVGTPHPP